MSGARFLLIGAMLYSLNGCYLYRQGKGHLSILFNAIPLEEAIQKETDPKRKALLSEIPKIKSFAEKVLLLDKSDNYQEYSNTRKNGVTYVVTASPKEKLIPHTWWFPIVGDVPYKGFFDKQDAFDEAKELEQEGYDTWIFSAKTYSTLGWFDDPVTTSMIQGSRYNLTETLIHEMVHHTLYVDNHGEFNEQMASFVGAQGAKQYLLQNNDFPKADLKKIHLNRQKLFVLVSTYAKELNVLYQEVRAGKRKIEERTPIFHRLSNELAALFPRSKKQWTINNARILQFQRYRSESKLFRMLWEQSGKNWKIFWDKVRKEAKKEAKS